MGFEIPVFSVTLEAAADLSTKQYLAIKVDTNGKAAVAAAGENAVGILQNVPEASQAATVMALGVSNAIYGGVVAAGSNLTPDAAGKLVTAGGSDAVIGVALTSGVNGQVGTVLLVTRTATGTTGIAKATSILSIPIKLSKVANGDIVTNYTPGFAGTIKKASFVVTDPVTTAAKAATLNLEIGATNLTGGAVALTSANCTPLGAVVNGAAITGANSFTNVDTISVEASSVTAFVEGEGVLLVVVETA